MLPVPNLPSLQHPLRLVLLRQPQKPLPPSPRCAHCNHPKRDHDGHADHRAKFSPLVAGDPWCHACNAACDYAPAEQPEPSVHGESVAALAGYQPDGHDTWDGEDSARIDRLRPEFTDHASVESIDAQLRRARAQERRWHIRVEWLISLRADRVAQQERGEWPAVDARQDGAQQS